MNELYHAKTSSSLYIFDVYSTTVKRSLSFNLFHVIQVITKLLQNSYYKSYYKIRNKSTPFCWKSDRGKG
jgi:hypothetical protein